MIALTSQNQELGALSAPVFLLSRGIEKTRAKCRCHEDTCAWSKLHKTQCLKLESTAATE